MSGTVYEVKMLLSYLQSKGIDKAKTIISYTDFQRTVNQIFLQAGGGVVLSLRKVIMILYPIEF